jgi:uncharacterized protein (TIGR03032 family)
MNVGESNADSDGSPFKMRMSSGLEQWLSDNDTSLAFALPPSKLVFVGRDQYNKIAVYERSFDKTMGLSADGTKRIYMGGRYQIWRFDDVPLTDEAIDNGFDRCFAPRQTWITGNINVHDVAVDPRGGPAGGVILAATRFSCLARPSDRHGFEPVWQPPFVKTFRPGDRCHLNGLAMGAQGPAYVTAVGATDDMERWRTERRGGGVVIDVPSGETVARGLSMPHSPRMHDGSLYVAHSGEGALIKVDPESGTWTEVGFAPGFLRGLTMVGNYAIVGSSMPRSGDLYSGLPLDDRLAEQNQKPRLGLFIFDLRTGAVAEWLFIEGPMREIFDVVALPGVRRPMAYGIVGPELGEAVWIDSRRELVSAGVPS